MEVRCYGRQQRWDTSCTDTTGGGGCAPQWYEGEVERALMLSKALAVADATQSISKAPKKVGAQTRTEEHDARKAAAPVYLRSRVGRRKKLPRAADLWQEAGLR